MTKKENKAAVLDPTLRLDDMTPRQILAELDQYIIGQEKAKRALALAIRNRVRRQRLPADMAQDVQPKNIILIGSTGVGKTELARRLARLSNSPFIKVEASKFTEVGYVGRDVESIVRDLTEIAVDMLRQEKTELIGNKAESNAEERILDILVRKRRTRRKAKTSSRKDQPRQMSEHRERLRKELRDGKLDQQMVELEVHEKSLPFMDFSFPLLVEEDMESHYRDLLAGMAAPRSIKRKMKIEDAIDYLTFEEESKLVDMEQITREALDRVEQSGIVFVDELDKVAGRESGHGPDVSREGVQRDILPIIEGTCVNTRFGIVQTDHILFIAAGAFHVTRPSDLIPELQGRFPVRVEMDSLTENDFIRILQEPRNALIRQYQALLATEGLELEFSPSGVREIARLAWLVNETTEDIGARRLHTVMEALLEEISFQGAELENKRVKIDRDYVNLQLAGIVKDSDLSRYIL